jgi:hypothetical protein
MEFVLLANKKYDSLKLVDKVEFMLLGTKNSREERKSCFFFFFDDIFSWILSAVLSQNRQCFYFRSKYFIPSAHFRECVRLGGCIFQEHTTPRALTSFVENH